MCKTELIETPCIVREYDGSLFVGVVCEFHENWFKMNNVLDIKKYISKFSINEAAKYGIDVEQSVVEQYYASSSKKFYNINVEEIIICSKTAYSTFKLAAQNTNHEYNN